MKRIQCKSSWKLITVLVWVISLGIGCGAKPQATVLGPIPTLSSDDPTHVGDRLGDQFLHGVSSATDKVRGGGTSGKRGAHDISPYLERAKAAFRTERFEEALDILKEAYQLSPDRDVLMLSAVARHKLYLRDQKTEQCQQALMAWQRFVSACPDCQQSPYWNQSVTHTNTLGQKCGAWTRWESTPSLAQISIDETQMGITPTEMWLPEGSHSYLLQRGTTSLEGQVKIVRGEQRSVVSQLVEGVSGTFSMMAQLRCAHPANSEASPLEVCANHMVSGDLFTLMISANQELYVYLFNESDGKLSLALPQQGKSLVLRPQKETLLPSRDVFKLDELAKRDIIWVVGSLQPLTFVQQGFGEGWQSEFKSLIRKHTYQMTQDRQRVGSREGIAVVGWALRGLEAAPQVMTADLMIKSTSSSSLTGASCQASTETLIMRSSGLIFQSPWTCP